MLLENFQTATINTGETEIYVCVMEELALHCFCSTDIRKPM